MSVQTEITRIQSAKRAISEAIGAKGVEVPPTAKLEDLAALVSLIVQGGGGGGGFDPAPFSAIKTETWVPAQDTTQHDLANTMENIAAIFMFSKDSAQCMAGSVNVLNPSAPGFSTFKFGVCQTGITENDGYGASEFIVNYKIGKIQTQFNAAKEYVFLLCYGPLK